MSGHYILFTSIWKMYTKNVFLIWLVNFQSCAAIKKVSIYYFINNIWYKYTGITKQKNKYLMADKNYEYMYTEN
jgi:hypothetical protein